MILFDKMKILKMNPTNKIFQKIVIPLSKWQIKLFLALFAFSIVLAVVLFTQILVNEITKREQKSIQVYAKIYKHIFDPNNNFDGLDLFLEAIPPTITFPIIMTDKDDNPLPAYESYTLNIKFDNKKSIKEQEAFLRDYIKKMGADYDPILIKDEKGEVLQKFYYTHSRLVDQLRFFPLGSILIIAAFIFVGYVAFSTTRRNEQSKVWVGMAREAAHQLGTPLSSLMAWVEIIKYGKNDPAAIEETVSEMQNDIDRLSTIATRFSKIGSLPEKEYLNLNELIENICIYFEKRLPHLGKKVEIVRNLGEPVFARVNADLIAWVVENLLKNAAEAIEDKNGVIEITGKHIGERKIYLYFKDNGKGMTANIKRQIFNPGYTTKKRGWGLGLSLTKRIIEEYHNGKIFIKESSPGKGTTFAIELPLKDDIET